MSLFTTKCKVFETCVFHEMQGFATLAAGGAHDILASSLAISFASRVVQEVTRRPRQLMDEPRPCSSTLSDLENRGCGMVVWKSFLDSTLRMVESWLFAKRGIVRLAVEGR